MKNYIYGNWKMNQTVEEVQQFAKSFNPSEYSCEMGLAPQSIHISTLLNNLDLTKVKVGAQNCSHETKGAFTGETSPLSLSNLGAHFVLVGHSERRQIFNEDSLILKKKLNTVLNNGLKVIFCVGETLQERESGNAFEVINRQLEEVIDDNHHHLDSSRLLVAYEPVWAIGTGKAATPAMAEEMHAHIRKTLTMFSQNLDKIPLLYGGSVKPENAKELLSMENINGALIGGASLKAESFDAICKIASN